MDQQQHQHQPKKTPSHCGSLIDAFKRSVMVGDRETTTSWRNIRAAESAMNACIDTEAQRCAAFRQIIQLEEFARKCPNLVGRACPDSRYGAWPASHEKTPPSILHAVWSTNSFGTSAHHRAELLRRGSKYHHHMKKKQLLLLLAFFSFFLCGRGEEGGAGGGVSLQ